MCRCPFGCANRAPDAETRLLFEKIRKKTDATYYGSTEDCVHASTALGGDVGVGKQAGLVAYTLYVVVIAAVFD